MLNSKESIRKQILSKRKAMSETDVKKSSLKIQNSLIGQLEGIDYESVLVYMPIANEVDLRGFIDYLWLNNKRVYLPKVVGQNIELVRFENDSKLRKEVFEIMVPDGAVDTKTVPDIIIVPCVACDICKNRLGFGKGYYDRFLKEHRNTKVIGVCYDFQVFEKLPKEDHDVPLDLIITEKQHIS